MTENDPFRVDAVPVYRWLRATSLEGGATVEEIAFQCFPLPDQVAAAAVPALRRASVGRVLDSLSWLRANGVVVLARPSGEGDLTRFVVPLL